MPDIQRQQIGRYGAHKSWAQTKDRTARTSAGRRAGPNGLDWHLARLDPVVFADATDAQRLAAAEAARHAFYAEMAMRSARVRSRKP